MNCDQLTVSLGSLHTAFNIKDNFSKKLSCLMQKYRLTPTQGIYMSSCASGGCLSNKTSGAKKLNKMIILKVERGSRTP